MTFRETKIGIELGKMAGRVHNVQLYMVLMKGIFKNCL